MGVKWYAKRECTGRTLWKCL